MSEPTIAAGFARALIELAVARGADRTLLLERSGLDPERLRDQDNRIPFEKYVMLMREGQALSGEPALALYFGEAFEMADLSIVGLIGQASETVGEAFSQLNRFASLVIEGPGTTEGDPLVLSRQEGRLWLVDRRVSTRGFFELIESSFARMVCTARRAGTARFIEAVHVMHPAPIYRAEYDRIFKVPVVFASDRNALLMSEDESWLARRLATQPRYVFGVFSERAEKLLKSLEGAKTTRGQVEGSLMPILHTGKVPMERIAAKLGVSRQTLFRRLKAEGITYEMVLSELRHRLALDYLTGNKVTVSETAYLVGFSDPAAFSRAFKRWTGSTPRDVRHAS